MTDNIIAGRASPGVCTWERLVEWDERQSRRLRLAEEAKWPRLLALVGAHSGDGAIWLPLALALSLLGRGKWRRAARRVLAAILLAFPLVTLIKWVVSRERPREPGHFSALGAYERYAFPSGHAARVAGIAVVVTCRFPGWGLLAIPWTVAVVLCRVALGVHYLSDVLAGLGLGTALGLAVQAGFNAVRKVISR
jgi:undecaprenyl-diphosphatase